MGVTLLLSLISTWPEKVNGVQISAINMKLANESSFGLVNKTEKRLSWCIPMLQEYDDSFYEYENIRYNISWPMQMDSCRDNKDRLCGGQD